MFVKSVANGTKPRPRDAEWKMLPWCLNVTSYSTWQHRATMGSVRLQSWKHHSSTVFFRLRVCSHMFNRQHNWNSELQIDASRILSTELRSEPTVILEKLVCFHFQMLVFCLDHSNATKRGLRGNGDCSKKKKKNRNCCQEDWIISGAPVCFQLHWMATSQSRSEGSLGQNLLSHLKNCCSF